MLVVLGALAHGRHPNGCLRKCSGAATARTIPSPMAQVPGPSTGWRLCPCPVRGTSKRVCTRSVTKGSCRSSHTNPITGDPAALGGQRPAEWHPPRCMDTNAHLQTQAHTRPRMRIHEHTCRHPSMYKQGHVVTGRLEHVNKNTVSDG